eukprot:CAMPEP_0176035286 /NCGR_PEP_ID=MMETSP0120_2-20121206/17450_1 /TAXON_ID=160619 /ORGANISM="Kryptoperidinium foliaceum, Strain CCMP 1326" /LENGTH=149 /DNA_ID=CAMNT_0017368633 /DNA_START=14 /DNA_END=459 /DNA_ORIENTATION=+
MGGTISAGELPEGAPKLADGSPTTLGAQSSFSLPSLPATSLPLGGDGGVGGGQGGNDSGLAGLWLEALRRAMQGVAGSPSSSCGGGSPEKVTKVVFFDFDRTLTVVHVFKSLAGWVDQEVGMLGGLGAVARPHAITEKGQLMRTCELGT